MKLKFFNLFVLVSLLVVSGVFFKSEIALASCGNEPAVHPSISTMNSPTGVYSNPSNINVNISGERSWFCSHYNPHTNSGSGVIDRQTSLNYIITNSVGTVMFQSGAANSFINHTVDVSAWSAGIYTITATIYNNNPNPAVDNPNCQLPGYSCSQYPDFYGVMSQGNEYYDTQGHPLDPLPMSRTFTITRTTSPMSGTLIPPSSTCTIPSGQSTCTQTLTWTTTNPVGTSAVTNNGGATPSSANGNNGSQLFTVRYNTDFDGVTTFYLYNNSEQLALATVTTTCGGNSTWNGSTCSADIAPSGTISATSCTIPIGSSTCTSSVTWDTQNRVPGANTAVTRNNPNNTTVSTNTSATNFSNIVNEGSSTFYLYHNNLILAQAPITARCEQGAKYNGSLCVEENAPIDGRWETGDWGPCINGVRTRTVTCIPPSNGGSQCPLPQPPTTQACAGPGPGGPGGPLPIAAKCAANHYNCVVGTNPSGSATGGSNVNGISKWTWTCNGKNGGASAACTELKKKPIFIEN